MSQNIGRAPLRATVPAVAKNVYGVVITSSPGPIPKAMRASSNASVPEETPTACAHRQYCAAAFSNSVTYGPRMNCWLAQILSRTGIISAANAWYCPFRSSRGTVIAGVKLGTTAILIETRIRAALDVRFYTRAARQSRRWARSPLADYGDGACAPAAPPGSRPLPASYANR